MNNRCRWLLVRKLWEMLVAVMEVAIADGETRGDASAPSEQRCITLLAIRHAAFAAMGFFGLTKTLSSA
ncbi:hypothetical protein AB3X91_39180 [Paraburkholderia sp. BR14263]|uniref:hypothetical protein n=1 Tax=unclassified Paraburkholderia TaxID=2615204 RepID=UPI0034CE3A2F